MQRDRCSMPPVTVTVMTYNQVAYVEDAVRGAFSQDYRGPLEILISDDCSTDGTTELLHDLVQSYDGPHQIRLNVNHRNLGLISHLHKLFAMASNDFLVCMAGDDISYPQRVTQYVDMHQKTGAWLVFSKSDYMNMAGEPIEDPKIDTTFGKEWSLAEAACSSGLFIGATAGYHRDIMTTFGPLTYQDAFEDLVLGFRAAMAGRVAFCDEALVRYRVGHGLSHADANQSRSLIQAHCVRLAVLRQRLDDAKAFGLRYEGLTMTRLRDALATELDVLARLKAGE